MGGLSLITMLLGAATVGQPPEPHIGSYLYEPAYILNEELIGAPRPYQLQPGDICFAVNDHVISRLGHYLSGAGLPNHSMIVFALPDGRLGIVEAGPHSRPVLEVNEAYAHLRSYEKEQAQIWVRQRRTPLTPEQSAALTRFCMAQHGKAFPVGRLLAQLTPFRSRMPWKAEFAGKVDFNQISYFCSELVLNSLAYAGVLEAEVLRPSATYPSDLFFSSSPNAFVERGVRLLHAQWYPPARWVSNPFAQE